MTTITEEEYRRRLSTFVADQKGKLPVDRKPQGFFGNWGFYVLCQKQFDAEIAEEGVEVIRPVVDWPEQTGRIPG